MGRKVLVTGASGFIAKHIVLQLLDAGYEVTGSLRTLDRADEVRSAVAGMLKSPDSLERLDFVHLDLSSDTRWTEALAGKDALLHTASPFPMGQPKTEEDLIRPAVDGTLRALKAAAAQNVRRVILTSSVAAVTQADPPRHKPAFDEVDWSDLTHATATPYVKSKTLAERAAWDFASENGLALTTINPALVLGPPLDARFGTSVKIIERMLKGKDPMLPHYGLPIVDVRDVAFMHVAALRDPETTGARFLATAGFLWMSDMADVLREMYPDRKIPKRTAPNILIKMLARFDPSLRSLIPSLGVKQQVSSSRARRLMNLSFRPPREAVQAAGAFLVDNGLV